MLEVNQLSRCYGTFVAVEDVSFDIAQGEIVGLLGHNGAGKTTIMKMLSAYLEPNQGTIRFNGIDLAAEPKKVQSQLGYLPENLPLYPELLVADYLDYAATLKGLRGRMKQQEIKRVVQATEIGVKLLEPISTLSRGYKQRVGVAQAVLGQPSLLILDEPTNGLDPTQTEHMRELIRDIASQATVILSTHILQEVDAVCDRVLILRDKKLVVDEKLRTLHHSNHLLVHTSLDEQQMGVALERLSIVDKFDVMENEVGDFHFRLTLSEDGDSARLANAQVAQTILAEGGSLYQLYTEHRDLETLFKEVNQHGA